MKTQRYGQAGEKPSLLELFATSVSIFAIYRKGNYLQIKNRFFRQNLSFLHKNM